MQVLIYDAGDGAHAGTKSDYCSGHGDDERDGMTGSFYQPKKNFFLRILTKEHFSRVIDTQSFA